MLLPQSQENTSGNSVSTPEIFDEVEVIIKQPPLSNSDNELSFARLAHIIEGEATILQRFVLALTLAVSLIVSMGLLHLEMFISIPSCLMSVSAVFIISARKAMVKRVKSTNLTTSMPKSIDTLRKSLRLLKTSGTSIEGEREAILDGLKILLPAIQESDCRRLTSKDNVSLLKLLNEDLEDLQFSTLDVLAHSGNQQVIDHLDAMISAKTISPAIASKTAITIEKIRHRLSMSPDSLTLLRSASENHANDNLLTAVSSHPESQQENLLKLVHETQIQEKSQ